MTNYLAIAIKNYASNYADLPGKCWQGIILTCINAMSIGVCFFLSLYFVDVLHLSVATAGMLISCYGLGTVTGGIVGGKLSDRFAPRAVSVLSLFTQSVAFIFLLKGWSVRWLMVNLFILGIASYGFKTSNNVWVLNQFDTESQLRLRTIGISHVASNLGLGLSGIFVAELSQYGFHNIFLISFSLLFLSAIFLLTRWEKETMPLRNKANGDSNNRIQIKQHNPKSKQIVFLMLTSLFLVGMIIAQLSSTYPIYVQQAFPQLGIKAVSILFILDTILIVLFQAPLTSYINKYNKILVVGTGAFLMGFGMLVLSFSSLFELALLSCVIWTLGEMLFMTPAQLLCYENGAEKKKGQTMGIFQSTYAASCVIGPTVGSLIYQYFGGNLLWYISAAIGALCLITCFHHRNAT